MTDPTATRTTRAERLAMPLAREVVRDLAVEHGACIRPVQLRRTKLDTDDVEQILVPCGHTLASVCPSCAERARVLRAAQCREGWHLEHEPVTDPDPATEDQRWWIQTRAEAQALRDQAARAGQDTSDLDELVTELDDEITNAGMRGNVLRARPARRHRSSKRRQDALDLPRLPLFGQHLSRIAVMTTSQIITRDDQVLARFGQHEIPVPDSLGRILTDLIRTGRSHTGTGSPITSPWLFPGGMPGRPITPSRLGERLRALGVRAMPGRRAALIDLAAQLPAAVLADSLNLSPGTAVHWMHQAGADWNRYAADITRSSDHQP